MRRIEIATNRLVDQGVAGDYHSVFKGLGMEFAEVRPYQPGDDVRTLDWNVTARMGTPFVKKYVEERDLTIFLVIDVSGSLSFGSRAILKRELAAEIAALLAFAALRNQDRVGAALVSDRLELFLPPQRRRTHVLRLVREVLDRPARGGTDLESGLQAVLATLKRRSVLFVISDFVGASLHESDQGRGGPPRPDRGRDRRPARRGDPRLSGPVVLRDAETGELALVQRPPARPPARRGTAEGARGALPTHPAPRGGPPGAADGPALSQADHVVLRAAPAEVPAVKAWLVLFLLAAPAAAQPRIDQSRMEVSLSPTQPTVGDRVQATLTLKVKTAELLGEPRFPVWRNTWGTAEVLAKSEPLKVREENGVAVWEQKLTLAAFRTGKVELPPVEAALPFRNRTVAARTPPGLALEVRSVIPTEEKDPQPRPPKPPVPLPFGSPFTWTVAALSAACLALGFLLWRRRDEAGEEAGRPLLSPFDELARDLDRLLSAEPSGAQAHARLSLALRRYLGRALSFRAAEKHHQRDPPPAPLPAHPGAGGAADRRAAARLRPGQVRARGGRRGPRPRARRSRPADRARTSKTISGRSSWSRRSP